MTSNRNNRSHDDHKIISSKNDNEVSISNGSFYSKQNGKPESEESKLERLAITFLEIIGHINNGWLIRKFDNQEDQEDPNNGHTEEEGRYKAQTKTHPRTKNRQSSPSNDRAGPQWSTKPGKHL